MKQTKKSSTEDSVAIVEVDGAARASGTTVSSKSRQAKQKDPILQKKIGGFNKGSKAAKPKNNISNKSEVSTQKKGALKRQNSASGSTSTTSITSASSSKKKRGATANKAEPPYPLYRDVSKATVSEGFESIVNLLRGRKNVVVLTGAGISVSCGIPDFRSRGSGLYSTLDTEELGLTCPEDLFDWEMFQEDPRPFFKFARNLYFPLMGNGDKCQRVRPSDSHKLLALLEQKKMLLRVYSQNIDGLEQVAGVSPKKVVYAHGSLQWATCCKCKHKVTAQEIEPAILKRTVPLCQEPIQGRSNGSPNSSATSISSRRATTPPQLQPSRSRKRPRHLSDDFQPQQEEGKRLTCNGVLKPGVTFFGESLNDTVRKSLESDRNKVDALIVIGTSLSVAPMSKVISYLPGNIPRILINRAIVHPKHHSVEKTQDNVSDDEEDEEKDFRQDYVFDAYLLGYCDDVTRLLAKKLFSTETRDGDGDQREQNQTFCQILSTVRQRSDNKSHVEDAKIENDDDEKSVEPEMFKAEDWAFCKVPEDRVVLFHGAEPSRGGGYGNDGEEDANSEVTFKEVAHCDGCSKRIEGTIQKCVDCFDYDLCQKCYPKLSKAHYNGEHVFAAEPAAVVDA